MTEPQVIDVPAPAIAKNAHGHVGPVTVGELLAIYAVHVQFTGDVAQPDQASMLRAKAHGYILPGQWIGRGVLGWALTDLGRTLLPQARKIFEREGGIDLEAALNEQIDMVRTEIRAIKSQQRKITKRDDPISPEDTDAWAQLSVLHDREQNLLSELMKVVTQKAFGGTQYDDDEHCTTNTG